MQIRIVDTDRLWVIMMIIQNQVISTFNWTKRQLSTTETFYIPVKDDSDHHMHLSSLCYTYYKSILSEKNISQNEQKD